MRIINSSESVFSFDNLACTRQNKNSQCLLWLIPFRLRRTNKHYWYHLAVGCFSLLSYHSIHRSLSLPLLSLSTSLDLSLFPLFSRPFSISLYLFPYPRSISMYHTLVLHFLSMTFWLDLFETGQYFMISSFLPCVYD